jgi:hypothetical protein
MGQRGKPGGDEATSFAAKILLIMNVSLGAVAQRRDQAAAKEE